MCGIAGLILEELDPRGPGWVTAMTQRLYHRGPDAGGAVVFGMGGTPVVRRILGGPDEDVQWPHMNASVALGARRLAIIDLSAAGRQPMSSPDGQVWLVFNGELYNHEALRDELRGRGMTFVGGSDTEVLLAAYRAWGRDCFARLEGMWAAAIVDWGARLVFWSRDRLGIKPLYLTRFDRGLAFASEIKSLLLLPGVLQGVNEARLRDFLSEGLVDHTDDTLFEGVWSFPPGCWAEIDLRIHASMQTVGTVQRYWRPGLAGQDSPDAPQQVLAALREAVRSHLRSDVPVGSCLSGGLDSSAVVALVHGLAAERSDVTANWSQHTFTASLPGSSLDEAGHASAVVQACPGLLGHTITPTAERLLESLPALVWHQEQPFGSPSIYLQWEVMRLARETGVTVLLDGQGGDELFCGYEGYLPAYLAHLLRRGRLAALAREFRGATADYCRDTALAGHVAAYLLPRDSRARLRRRANACRQRWLAGDLFSVDEPPEMYAALRLEPSAELGAPPGETTLTRHLWSVLLHDSLPSLLRFEDRNSMAFCIEARVPLLDRTLVELAMSLPIEQKIVEGRLKVVLREAVRGLVPDSIMTRRDKIGFSAPTADWLRGGLREWWSDLLGSKSFRERGCFREKGVHRLIERFEQAGAAGDTARTAAAATQLWRLAIVEQWARRFLDG